MKPGDSQSVENLFNDLAPSYDLFNDLLSFGLHRVWKRQLLTWMQPIAGENWLDVCCGTGDLALSLARFVRPGGTVLGIDSAAKTLEIAKKRAKKKPWLPLSWMQGDALDTGLPDNHFDGAVMAFGLRNIVNPIDGLKELHRILKPDARAGILDFNPLIKNSLQGRFQTFYLRQVVVPLAAQAGFRDHYSYLEESLRVFPQGSTQESLALEAGFKKACHRTLAAGQMGALLIHN